MATALAIPDPAPREVQNAKPYDFSPPDFESMSAINHLVAGVGGTQAPQLQVSHQKPAYFDYI
jgi:hypothetical protein